MRSENIRLRTRQVGQGLVEYALILVLVALVVILSVTALGGGLSDVFSSITTGLNRGAEDTQSVSYLIGDFSRRILDFRNENGRWPKSWGDERFTELGLDPKDWEEPVSDILWIPHGDNIGLGNVYKDNIRLYVNKVDGSKMEIYTVVWCYPTSSRCYYRFPEPENEVDINTLEIVYTD
jgi:Flp pilus assembly pilin Flp